MSNLLINNKYRITRRIGGGSFGEIFMGVGLVGEKVAIKFERQVTRCPQLRHEYKVYRELASCLGFCSVYFFGTQDNFNVMVMDLLGPSLEDLFNRCSRRFSLKTVLQIADQILDRIDCLHTRHLIHRDIKPANFTIGINEAAGSIYCVDFGLSKRYRHPKTLQHIPHRDGRSLTGTPRYASINNHLGIEQSRRDDLESVGYILVYFLKGSLPWQGLKAKNPQKKYRLILEKKQQVSIAQLCQGLPSQFAEFLAYSRSLKFDAKPDIAYLKKMFRDLYYNQGLSTVPKLWDWEGMDMDYSPAEAVNNNNGGIGLPGMLPNGGNAAMNPLLRPNTAAAVATNAGMLDNDIMLGNDGYGDPYETIRPVSRPSNLPTAVMTGKATTPGAQPTNNATSWLWGSRQQQAQQSNNDNYARSGTAQAAGTPGYIIDLTGNDVTPSNYRRPHTAHGSRLITSAPAGTTTDNTMPQLPIANDASGKNIINLVDDDDNDIDESNPNHVVAGARAMMRYRRTRNNDNQPQVVNLVSQSGTQTGRSWNGNVTGLIDSSTGVNNHNNAGKESMNAAAAAILSSSKNTAAVSGNKKLTLPNASPAGPNVGNITLPTGGWNMQAPQQQAMTSIDPNRPKSAANSINNNNNNANGGKLFSNGAGTTTTAANPALASLSSSLKNRFLSGNTGTPTAAAAVGATSNNSAGNGNGVGGMATRSTKLFGMGSNNNR